jgi:hypothetical protein
MITIDPIAFKAWQIEHYTQRLSEAGTTEARSFLRRELHNLKKQTNDRHSSNEPVCDLAVQAIME